MLYLGNYTWKSFCKNCGYSLYLSEVINEGSQPSGLYFSVLWYAKHLCWVQTKEGYFKKLTSVYINRDSVKYDVHTSKIPMPGHRQVSYDHFYEISIEKYQLQAEL